MSGHLLRNECKVWPQDPEYKHYPYILLEPLAVIKTAIKHERQRFLAQNVVHAYMRSEWVGGGVAEQSSGYRIKQNCIWIGFWWLILPANALVLLAIATYPPFGLWYRAYLARRFDKNLTARTLLGLSFVPAFQFAMSEVADFAMILLFSFARTHLVHPVLCRLRRI